MKNKWVYLFNEVDQAEKKTKSWDGVRTLLGGKGANLADMTRIGVPVPPGFTVTTEACNAYLAGGGKFPEGMWDQVIDALHKVEKEAGKKFGDPKNPLLVSCRSGAKFSMPGMMDTVLNIGLNDETAEGMVKLTGDARFVYDAYRRLVQMFGSVVMGLDASLSRTSSSEAKTKAGVTDDAKISPPAWKELGAFKEIVRDQAGRDFPQDPLKQLELATEAVFRSWNGKRAIDYRNAAEDRARPRARRSTFRRWSSATWAMTPAPAWPSPATASTGDRDLYGDYLINAQGEDVVAGIRNTNADRPAASRRCPRSIAQFGDICQTARRATTATCRTSSSRSSAASCGCCRPATASARRGRRSVSRSTWSKKG